MLRDLEESMDVLRTPDERFAEISGLFAPHYLEIESGLRMHFVDEGPRDAPAVLMLHGEPSWSFLYRKVIASVVRAGLRAVAPDLVGFGRSDKPAHREDYTYQRHVDWMTAFLERTDLKEVTLLCQDWGGLIGLRLVAERGERFARVVAANTFLPTGDRKPSDAFFVWRQFSQDVPEFPTSGIVLSGCARPLATDVLAAYDAPFPDESYKAGARQFPMLVPATPDDPAAEPNRRAWESLDRWEKPFLTLFGDKDPVTRGAEKVLQARIPGAKGQPHAVLVDAGHFLQEDVGEELAQRTIDFIRTSI
jgi:haloalkane dehalogenase